MWDPSFNVGRPVTPWQQMQMSLVHMIDVLENDLQAKDMAHIAVIQFGDKVDVSLPLTPVRDNPTIFQLGQQISTNYAAAFKELGNQMRQDQQRLGRDGYESMAPAVYFITDGNPQVDGIAQPIDHWLPLRRGLSSLPAGPTIIALGLGGVTADTIRAIRSEHPTGVACIAEGGEADELLREIIDSIIHSIGSSSAAGRIVFRVPDGMTRLD
jgi:uncharacterized protein YegL